MELGVLVDYLDGSNYFVLHRLAFLVFNGGIVLVDFIEQVSEHISNSVECKSLRLFFI